MSLTIIGTPRKYRTDRGWRVVGTAAFTTTALTGELRIDEDCGVLSGVPNVWMLSGPSHVMNLPTGTIATSGATPFNIVSPYAGIVTSAAIVSGVGQAAHSTIVFDWHMINKGQAGTGTAVVIDRATAGNTLDTDVDVAATALTAFVPKALTLTGVTADKTVAAGDVLNFAWTAGGSTPTSQTGTSLILKMSSDGSSGDERVWVDERALVNVTNGRLFPTDNGPGSARYTVTVNRWSTNPKSGAIFGFSYESGT